MIRLLILLLLFSLSLHATAQDKTILAKSEYLAAEEAYSNGNFEKCLTHLAKSKEHFGGSNYLIQYLEVKALYGDGQIIAASNSIDTFFKTIQKENNDTPEFSEMVKLLTTIKEEEKKVNTQYEKVIQSNDAKLARKYLNDYAKAREASAIHKIISIAADEYKKIQKKIDRVDYGYGPEDTPTLLINGKLWQSKNLNVDHFANGDPILNAQTQKEWELAAKEKRPAWCYYKNESANGLIYGKLYNWYSVSDLRGLCPQGWHISRDDEWGHISKVNQINGGAGGTRSPAKGFERKDKGGYWWTSSASSKGFPLWYGFYNSTRIFNNESANITNVDYWRGDGKSCRCVRD